MSYELKSLSECALDQLVDLESGSFTSDRISARSFRRLLMRPTAAGHGAVEGQNLLGYSLLLFRSNSSRARLYSLAVASGQRGRGIGRTLIGAAVELARKRGCKVVQLEVSAANELAIRLYQSAGFQLSGKRESYYEDGSDALIYVLEVSPTAC